MGLFVNNSWSKNPKNFLDPPTDSPSDAYIVSDWMLCFLAEIVKNFMGTLTCTTCSMSNIASIGGSLLVLRLLPSLKLVTMIYM